jgi:hypothetical protein
MLLLPMLYLPPASYMALLNAESEVLIESQENYIKSTYRNRCEIMGANGVIELSIPLLGGRDHHQSYRDTQIAYTGDWQHRHRMSIMSCYGSAPFFDHYIPYLEPFYEKQYTHLFDFNKELLVLLIRLMKLEVRISYTDTYEAQPIGMTDLRKAFKPRVVIDKVTSVPYMQVFESVDGSHSLSCLDLLFNEGPQSKEILKQMVVSL